MATTTTISNKAVQQAISSTGIRGVIAGNFFGSITEVPSRGHFIQFNTDNRTEAEALRDALHGQNITTGLTTEIEDRFRTCRLIVLDARLDSLTGLDG